MEPAIGRIATPEQLPIIDISPLYGGDEDQKEQVATKIRRACIDVGFFYVMGHRITQQQHMQLLQCITELFDLPREVKEKVAADLSQLHRGYTGLGGSHNCTQEGGGADQKESFLLGAEGRASPMHGPNHWPPESLLPHWKEHIQQYFSCMLSLSRTVAAGLALSLHLPEDFFENKMHDPVAQLLLLRYPPPAGVEATSKSEAWAGAAGEGGMIEGSQACSSCSSSSQAVTRGCGAHTDCGFLTILAQDDVPGLEVKLASGVWVQAPVVPGAYLVNLGDMMARWSNDVYMSTEHRVFNYSSKARHSAPFFCNCDFDAVVEPILTDVTTGANSIIEATAASAAGVNGHGVGAGPAKYPPIKAGQYIMQKLGLMWET